MNHRKRRGVFVAALVILTLGGARSRRAIELAGPTKHQRSDDRLAQNDDCEACHVGIAQEWRGSLHRASYTDPMVQVAIAGDRDPEFCRTCHAPEADPRFEPDPRRAQIGVGCVGCHVVDGEILAAPRSAPNDAARPHAVRREPAFASSQACASCHEFMFPAASRGGHRLQMQRTVSEHARSTARDQPCQACHMPPTATGGSVHRGHGFHVIGEPKMLHAAARISASRELDEQGQTLVRVRLEPRVHGHAFPTGDLFRRLVVRVDGPNACKQERYLARRFGLERLGNGSVIKVEVADERVGVRPTAKIVELVLPVDCAAQPLEVWVVYQRVLDTPVGAEHAAVVWDETVLAHERLEPAH